MSLKTSCAVCENKDISGIFKCEGCSQTFCLKHTNEHRQYLRHQLDEIIFEHDSIFNAFDESQQESSLLFGQIDQWEKDSIIKIQQAAHDARIELQQMDALQKGKGIFS